MKLPNVGERIQIHSYKHNGHIHRIWDETVVLKATPTYVIGGNNRTIVTESDGRTWVTREPAICFFHANYWFNVIGMIREDGIYYYCNLSSPFVIDDEALKYIDYDLDLKVFPSRSYIVLDEDEYARHRKEMSYPQAIDKILYQNVDELKTWIKEEKGPFSTEFIDEWYAEYMKIMHSQK